LKEDFPMTHHRPPPPRGSGDGWVTLSSGQVKWGLFGAAGMLLRHDHAVLLARRAEWVHGGNGQWSVPGGAIDKDEMPEHAALREFDEEIGPVPRGLRIVGIHTVVIEADVWSYHTCCALVDERPTYTELGTTENDEARWWHLDEVDSLPLFPPFAQALPHLLRIYDEAASA